MRSTFGAWHALCSRARLAALEAAHEQLVGTHESALAASAAQLQALREALGAGLTEAMEARGTLLTREEFHEWHATTLVADAGEAQDELLDLEQWVAGQSAALASRQKVTMRCEIAKSNPCVGLPLTAVHHRTLKHRQN